MTTLQGERERLLSRLLRRLSSLAVLAYVPGVVFAVREGVPVITVTNTVAYAAILFVAFVPGIALQWKLATVVAGCTLVAAVLLFSVGPLGAGYVWLIAAIVIAAVFGGTRAILAASVVSAAILAGYAYALSQGLEGHGATGSTILVIGTSALVVAIVPASILRSLLNRLHQALDEQRVLGAKLREELAASVQVRRELQHTVALKDELLREVHHRVNNNMQLVLSLLEHEEHHDGRPEVLHARIRTLSAMNDLLFRDHDVLRADLDEIVAVVHGLVNASGPGRAELVSPSSGERMAGIDRSQRVVLPAQQAVPVGLYLHELIVGLTTHGAPVLIHSTANGGRPALNLRCAAGTSRAAVKQVVDTLSGGVCGMAVGDILQIEPLAPGTDVGAGVRLTTKR